MAVLLVGTLDTKGVEVAFVRDLLRGGGVECLVLDAGVQGTPTFRADVTREEVFAAAGTTLAAVRSAGDRGRAVTAAARGRGRDLSRGCTPRGGSRASWAWAARPGRRSPRRPCASCRSACRSSWSARWPRGRSGPTSASATSS